MRPFMTPFARPAVEPFGMNTRISSPAQTETVTLLDTYSVDEAAPLTTPRTADVGTTTVVDGSGILSVAGGKLVWNGTPSAVTRQTSELLPHLAGRIIEFDVTSWTSGGLSLQVSTSSNSADSPDYGFQFITASRVDLRDATNSMSNMVSATTGVFRFVQREAGGYFFIAGDQLIWVSKGRGVSDVYVHQRLASSSAANLSTDNLKIYTAEPSGLNTEYGIATARIAAAQHADTLVTAADALIELTWTPKAGETLSLYVRRTDDDNTYRLDCDQAGGTIRLYRRQAGVDTELDSGKTQTWAVGTAYRLVVCADGPAIRTWVNNGIKHNTTSAYNASATGAKIASTNGAPTLNEWVSWPLDLTGFPFLASGA